LRALTAQHSTFSKHDLVRFVHRHTDGAEQFAAVLAKVGASPELRFVGKDGRGRDRFSTREMVETEARLERDAVALALSRRHEVGPLSQMRAMLSHPGTLFGRDQQAAFEHVLDGRDLAVVFGFAGTGKSTMLGVARAAWQDAGYRVRGAALSGIAAEGLEAGSGIPSRTLASLEFAWKDGRDALTARDVLVVDEAGMVGSRQLDQVVSRVRAAGAKLVLVGDPEQLQAIEAGAAFRAVAERVGAVEIAEVRRQRAEWQRDATRELATGRTAEALGRYARAGMVVGHDTREAARAALVEGWDRERRQGPERSRVILASTREDVAALNGLARERLRAAGALGTEQQVETERGARAFAAGDRVMFLRNERGLGADEKGRGGVAVKNGTLGTVLAVAAGGEQLTVRLDGSGSAAGQAGRDAALEVTFSVRDYAHLEYGYAATVHKAQGVTVDRAHVLASGYMDRHGAYTGLTRHRDGVALHYGRDEFADAAALARVLGRERAKDTSLDYGGAGTLRSEAGQVPARDLAQGYAVRRGLAPESSIVVRPVPAPAPAAPAPQPQHQLAAPEVAPARRGMFAGLKLGTGPAPDPEGYDLDAIREVLRDAAPIRRPRDVVVGNPADEAPPTNAPTPLPETPPGPQAAPRPGRGVSEVPAALGRLRPEAPASADPWWPDDTAGRLRRFEERLARERAARAQPAPWPWSQVPAEAHPLASLLPALPYQPVTAEEVAAAVETDADVRGSRDNLDHTLQRAYRDPAQARAQLVALEGEAGTAAIAGRLAEKPGLLGRLRGRTWLASVDTEVERMLAEGAVSRIGDELAKQRDAERNAADAFWRPLEERRRREAVEVPGLSGRALAALEAVSQAGAAPGRYGLLPWDDRAPRPDETGWAVRVAPVWTAIKADAELHGELQRFREAAGQRLPVRRADRPDEALSGPAAAVRTYADTLRSAESLWVQHPGFQAYAAAEPERQARAARKAEERRRQAEHEALAPARDRVLQERLRAWRKTNHPHARLSDHGFDTLWAKAKADLRAAVEAMPAAELRQAAAKLEQADRITAAQKPAPRPGRSPSPF